MGEVRRRTGAPRLLQHGGGIVYAGHVGSAIACDQERGRVAGTTTEIIDPVWRSQRHLSQQVTRRSGALISEFEVVIGVPVGHLTNMAPFGAERQPDDSALAALRRQEVHTGGEGIPYLPIHLDERGQRNRKAQTPLAPAPLDLSQGPDREAVIVAHALGRLFGGG